MCFLHLALWWSFSDIKTYTLQHKKPTYEISPPYLHLPCAKRFPKATDSPLTLAAINPHQVMVGGTPLWSHMAMKLNPCRGISGEAATTLHLLQRPYRGRRKPGRRNCSASKWPPKDAPGQGTLWQVSAPEGLKFDKVCFIPSKELHWTESSEEEQVSDVGSNYHLSSLLCSLVLGQAVWDNIL